jgi:hypothetical protein
LKTPAAETSSGYKLLEKTEAAGLNKYSNELFDKILEVLKIRCNLVDRKWNFVELNLNNTTAQNLDCISESETRMWRGLIPLVRPWNGLTTICGRISQPLVVGRGHLAALNQRPL